MMRNAQTVPTTQSSPLIQTQDDPNSADSGVATEGSNRPRVYQAARTFLSDLGTGDLSAERFHETPIRTHGVHALRIVGMSPAAAVIGVIAAKVGASSSPTMGVLFGVTMFSATLCAPIVDWVSFGASRLTASE